MAKSTSKRTDVSKGAFAADATVSERIGAALATLTPAHQRMAEYVLANPFRAATMRIDEFAAAVDMSIATANRFALALGFDGYPQFRAGLLRGFEATLAPVEKLRHELARPATSAEIFAASLNEDIANLDATRRMLDPATTGCGLDHDRVADAFRFLLHAWIGLVFTLVAGHARHTGGLHQALGAGLIAHREDGLRRWADKDKARFCTGIGKGIALGQEAIAGVHSLRARLARRLQQRRNVQVRRLRL